MEVGAVKQAFNNEVIHLKKKNNQAKTQVIHKLTRKAKTLTQKKVSEKLQEKLRRKAAYAIKEVILIKKITAKDLAKFTVTHKGELKDYLNKPTIDNDRVCARLLLHKTLHDKYIFLRQRFANVPIDDLLMSREERRRMKEEEREKQKKKREKRSSNMNIKQEGDWSVEDIIMDSSINTKSEVDNQEEDEIDSDSGNLESMTEQDINSNNERKSKTSPTKEKEKTTLEPSSCKERSVVVINPIIDKKKKDFNKNNKKLHEKTQLKNNERKSKSSPTKEKEKTALEPSSCKERSVVVINPIIDKNNKKKKDFNKNNMKLHEKIQLKNKEKELVEPKQERIADPFFITSTGEHYMSLVEPRLADEVKEVHREGNRKIRRAAMFGHVPIFRQRKDKQNFIKQNGVKDHFKSNFKQDKSEAFRGNSFDDRKKSIFIGKRKSDDENKKVNSEKLHPSWEAKKRQSGMLPFEGKKIVFE